MIHVFEPKVIMNIVAKVVFGDFGDGFSDRSECPIEAALDRVTESTLRDLYECFVQWLQDSINANWRGESGHSVFCLEKAKMISQEIARFEEQTRTKGKEQ
jgi:hypothetical protein